MSGPYPNNDRRLTAERANEVLSYDPLTGLLRWKQSNGPRAKIGEIAGSLGYALHCKVMVDGERIMSHRLIWLMVTGSWPENEIDHINGDGQDNRWVNLREATHRQNGKNKRLQRGNSSGYTGVTFTREGRWRAVIRSDGKRFHLGYFDTAAEAADAYAVAAQKLYGVFARAARPSSAEVIDFLARVEATVAGTPREHLAGEAKALRAQLLPAA